MARRILVVDDDRLSRLLTQSLLESLGFDVVVVDDGIAAVDAEAAGDFDAIIMDCQMPNMDGFEATETIRRHERSLGGHTPIIGLSVRAMEGDQDAAIAKGMDAYITKPVNLRKVRAALQQVTVAAG